MRRKRGAESIGLGNSGLSVCRLGMGCWAIGGHGWGPVKVEESIEAIRKAWELGINHFDTADVYGLGHSEETLARALGPHRHEAVIATKFGVRVSRDGHTSKDLRPAYLRTALEASLRRLRLECIPLYYAHWPDGKTPLAEVMEELLRCQRQGKIRSIGLSNFSAQQLKIALEVGPVDAVQIQFSLLERGQLAEVRHVLRGSPTTIATWGSLARGLLTGKFTADTRFGSDDSRSRDPQFQGHRFGRNLQVADRVGDVAKRLGVSAERVALRWVLDTAGVGCALFGAKTADQVAANERALGWSLRADLYRELEGCWVHGSLLNGLVV